MTKDSQHALNPCVWARGWGIRGLCWQINKKLINETYLFYIDSSEVLGNEGELV